nr:hypothetical protein Iba_chr02fCG12170 [Ipomoea batatas]
MEGEPCSSTKRIAEKSPILDLARFQITAQSAQMPTTPNYSQQHEINQCSANAHVNKSKLISLIYQTITAEGRAKRKNSPIVAKTSQERVARLFLQVANQRLENGVREESGDEPNGVVSSLGGD